jgi:hypothetical protein
LAAADESKALPLSSNIERSVLDRPIDDMLAAVDDRQPEGVFSLLRRVLCADFASFASLAVKCNATQSRVRCTSPRRTQRTRSQRKGTTANVGALNTIAHRRIASRRRPRVFIE